MASTLALSVSVRQMKLNAAYLMKNGKTQSEIDELLKGSDGLVDGGITISVLSADKNTEYVRLDMFDDIPHYHYFSNWHDDEAYTNYTIALDTAAVADPIDWAVQTLRVRAKEMVTRAGGEAAAAEVDWDVIPGAVDKLAQLVAERRARVPVS
ncbi:DUF7700 domain-containing protein [Pseudofrankia asymbiotica]|uniref:DUF7700 domain-containing protein n=1 Tax=Pseudofrankia asymbiotica TaxID=1834516 RepID=UPI00105637FD|nr:hypothetical protein [Pseudofrankia asymbiotica]